MGYLKSKNNILLRKKMKNFSLMMFISLYVLILPLSVFSQTQAEFQNSGGSSNLLQTAERDVSGENSHRLLYPQSLPKRVTPEDIGVDFASCIASTMTVKLSHSAIRGVAALADSFVHGISKATGAFASYDYGASAMVTSMMGEEKVKQAQEQIEKHGVFLGNLTPLLPSKDDIAFCAKQVAYAYLSATIIHWVNTAFNEGAIWVENFSAKLSQTASFAYRRAIGDVNLCVDVSASVRLGLDLEHLKTQAMPPRTGCTISVNERIELGAMYGGGYHNPVVFAELYSNPVNNAMGAFLVSDALAKRYVADDVNEITTELSWSRGWYPFKDAAGNTTTPGEMVKERVVDMLNLQDEHALQFGSGLDQAIFMISNQLIKQRLQKTINPLSN